MAKRRRVNKKNVLKLFITLLVVIGIIYLFIKGNFTPERPTYSLSIDNVVVDKTYKGFIIRKENVYRINSSGEITEQVNDGQRVKRNQIVMEITGKEVSETLVSQEISRSFDKETIENLDAKIAQYEQEIANAIKAGDYSDVKTLTENLDFTIRQRVAMTTEYDEESYEENLLDYVVAPGETASIKILHDGIISFYTDGLEKELTYNNILKIKVSDVINTIVEPVRLDNKSVQANDIVAKIIDDDYFYIVMQIEKEEISNFPLTKDIEIKVNGTPLTGYIDNYILSDTDAAVLLRIESFFEDYHKIRSVNVDIDSAVYEGLVIKKASLTTVDGQVGVYVKVRYEEFEFVPVKILGDLGTGVIVKADFFHEVEGQEVVRHSTVKSTSEVLLDASLMNKE